MASIKPSMKKISPIAVNNSLIFEQVYLFLIAGFTDLPKNLKNSLSGDKTSEVSPPILFLFAFFYKSHHCLLAVNQLF